MNPSEDMTSQLEQWQTNNDAYLAAALHWLRLRLRLQRLAASGQPLNPTPLTVQPPPRAKRRFWPDWLCFVQAEDEINDVKLLPPADTAITDEQIAQAEAAMQKAAQAEPPPALVILQRRLGLGRFETELLLLCVAMELDTRIAALCGQAQGDLSRRWPTFALGLTLFDEPVWEALSPERPLRYWRLLDINQPGAQPLTTSALRADERIVNYLKGLNYLDDRLSPFCTAVEIESGSLPLSQQTVVEQITAGVSPNSPLPVIQLLGLETATKQAIAARAAESLHLNLYRLPVEQIPSQPGELETLVRLWQRECLLFPQALLLVADESEKEVPAAVRLLKRLGGLVFLCTREAWPDIHEQVLSFDIGKPTSEEQVAAWRAELKENTPDVAASLAAQFNFSLAEIQRVARAVKKTGRHGFGHDALASLFARGASAHGHAGASHRSQSRLATTRIARG